MAIGLSRSLNLSESNLNLKEAIQKLYAPGIQDDIELFSLSSQIKSNIVSGPETDENSQIIGLRSETLRTPAGDVIKRTKFRTSTSTWSVGDKVWFDKFVLPPSTDPAAVNIIFSTNGSIPATNIVYSGGGYYFKEPSSTGETVPVRFLTDPVVIENVTLEGDITKSTSARATVTFKPEASTIFPTAPVLNWKEIDSSVSILEGAVSAVGGGTNTLVVNSDGSWNYVSTDSVQLSSNLEIEVTYTNGVKATYIVLRADASSVNSSGNIDLAPIGTEEQLGHLKKWTGFYTRRFYIDSIVLTNPGSGYLIGEKIKIVTETTVVEQSNSVSCVIDRQVGQEYFGYDPIMYVQYYKYEVRSSSKNGFYLFDPVVNKFVFLNSDRNDFNTVGAREIRIFRDDAVFVKNILQLRFAQSPVYHRSYNDAFSAGGNITGSVRGLSATADNLRADSFLSIQNTQNPEEVTSEDNTLGFRYNRILGNNMAVYQRLIMRDQDFVLGTAGVTGNRLKNDVQMTRFKLFGVSTVAAGQFTIGTTYTILTIGTTDFTTIGAAFNAIGEQFTATGIGSGNGTATTPNTAGASIRVPGLFIKVGAEYKRAFSTRDKPFLQLNDAGAGALNPAIVGDYATYGVGRFSLFAANRYDGSWYAYNTVLSRFAQRLAIPSTAADAGKNGALYFHKDAAPIVTTVGSGTNQYFEVPLFTFVS